MIYIHVIILILPTRFSLYVIEAGIRPILGRPLSVFCSWKTTSSEGFCVYVAKQRRGSVRVKFLAGCVSTANMTYFDVTSSQGKNSHSNVVISTGDVSNCQQINW
jgi:hypothetical protein